MLLVLSYVLISYSWADEIPVKESVVVETPSVDAADKFQQGLIDLKAGIDRLTVDNAALAGQNEALKGQLTQLRLQLGQTQQEQESLDQAALKLKATNETKTRQINEAREELASLNERLEKINAEIKLSAQGIEQKTKEEDELTKQALQMRLPLAAAVTVSPEVVEVKPDPRKEKLKLMKMIYDSKKHQEDLHESLLVAQKSAVSSGQAQAASRKVFLQEQIKQLEYDLAQMPLVEVPLVESNWTQEQLKQMEFELKNLQQNHDELEALIGQLQKKNVAQQVQPAERNEQSKLAANIGELKREGGVLKGNLSDLRNKMVELDKRKTRLEAMLR